MQMTQEAEQQYGISRLVAFSDGVFGFAITLLIVNVIGAFPPLPPSANEARIWSALLGLLPSFYAYALSFYMVGVYWVAHHWMFRYIIKYNATLIWINLTMLLFLVFLPFSTSLLDKYNNSASTAAFYAATLVMISFCSTFLWEYATSRRLVTPNIDQKTLRLSHWRGGITLALLLIATGFAFLAPTLAKVFLLAIFLIRPLLLRQIVKEDQ